MVVPFWLKFFESLFNYLEDQINFVNSEKFLFDKLIVRIQVIFQLKTSNRGWSKNPWNNSISLLGTQETPDVNIDSAS